MNPRICSDEAIRDLAHQLELAANELRRVQLARPPEDGSEAARQADIDFENGPLDAAHHSAMQAHDRLVASIRLRVVLALSSPAGSTRRSQTWNWTGPWTSSSGDIRFSTWTPNIAPGCKPSCSEAPATRGACS